MTVALEWESKSSQSVDRPQSRLSEVDGQLHHSGLSTGWIIEASVLQQILPGASATELREYLVEMS